MSIGELFDYIWLAILSMSPAGEHKIAIPVAIQLGMDPWIAWAVCITANMVSPPIIWWFLQNVKVCFQKWAVCQQWKVSFSKSEVFHKGNTFFVQK